MILKANKELKQKDFKNEKELQNFFENNTEFIVGDFRIDSLGFDEESKSFRIIEYKNVKNHSLVD